MPQSHPMIAPTTFSNFMKVPSPDNFPWTPCPAPSAQNTLLATHMAFGPAKMSSPHRSAVEVDENRWTLLADTATVEFVPSA